MFLSSRVITFRFDGRTQWQMSQLFYGRHFGVHVGRHHHGVSIQSLINLGETIFPIAREWKRTDLNLGQTKPAKPAIHWSGAYQIEIILWCWHRCLIKLQLRWTYNMSNLIELYLVFAMTQIVKFNTKKSTFLKFFCCWKSQISNANVSTSYQGPNCLEPISAHV